MKVFRVAFISSGFVLLFLIGGMAQKASDTLPPVASLQACVEYALKHYPQVQQAYLDEQITDRQIKSKLADWYPQVNLNANYQNNFTLQRIAFNGSYVQSGTYNSSYMQFALSQTLFNRDVLLAARTKGIVMNNIRQTTVTDKIDITVNVTKAF